MYAPCSHRPNLIVTCTLRYDQVHMLFWLAKDLSWNLDNISMWFLFLFPTILLGMDYLYLSWQVEVQSSERVLLSKYFKALGTVLHVYACRPLFSECDSRHSTLCSTSFVGDGQHGLGYRRVFLFRLRRAFENVVQVSSVQVFMFLTAKPEC